MDPLRGTELRIVRAYEHLNTFKDEVFKLRNQWPGFVIVENDPEPGAQLGTGIVMAFPLADYVSVYLGDFFQSLRAALDYAAWQCRPRDDTYFPICLTENGPTGSFDWWIDEKGVRKQGRGRKMLKGMTPVQGQVIRSLQPYLGGGKSHPLWMLHEYARRERHRLLMLTSGIVWAIKVDVPAKGTQHEALGQLPQVRRMGERYVLFDPPRTVPDPDVQFEPKTPITVRLPDIEGVDNGNVFRACDRILRYMNETVVPAFRNVFPP
jgi:hypothetical protein